MSVFYCKTEGNSSGSMDFWMESPIREPGAAMLPAFLWRRPHSVWTSHTTSLFAPNVMCELQLFAITFLTAEGLNAAAAGWLFPNKQISKQAFLAFIPFIIYNAGPSALPVRSDQKPHRGPSMCSHSTSSSSSRCASSASCWTDVRGSD